MGQVELTCLIWLKRSQPHLWRIAGFFPPGCSLAETVDRIWGEELRRHQAALCVGGALYNISSFQ